MKIVFRHLPGMGMLLLTFAMPFIATALVIIILSGAFSSILDPEAWLSDEGIITIFSAYIILGLGVGISVVMMNLIVYSTVITYNECNGEVSADNIGHNVKKYLGNYVISVFTQVVIGAMMLSFASIFAFISPVLFGVIYFMMIFAAVWVFNVIQFLGIVRIEENLSVIDGLKRCFYLIQNNWWETFGLIIVTSILGTLLMYGLIMLFVIVFGVFAGVYNTSGVDSPSILTYILYGIFILLYILIMSASNMYIAGVRILKYYDLIERKEAKNLVSAIEEIGQTNKNLFENEGDY